MTTQRSIEEILQRERKTIEEEKKKTPELFIREPIIDGPNELKRAGIFLTSYPNDIGYIRYYPQDFIVEELQPDGKTLSLIEPQNTIPAPMSKMSKTKTIYTDLIKANIPTLEAINRLSAALNLDPRFIGIAGIKDAHALTSQRISFRNTTYEKIKNLHIPNLFLTRFSFGIGAIQAGDLAGNRFTIVLRTKDPVEIESLEQTLHKIEKDGFLNFYGLQRFGTRLLSHWFGLLLLRGDYKGALESFLFESGPRDLPFYKFLRDKAKKKKPNWKEVRLLYESCPYTMQYEITVLKELEKGKTAEKAFAAIENQVKLWIYAYMSYLVNRMLSKKIEKVPEEIPIPLSNLRSDRALYQAWLKVDKVPDENFKKLVSIFPFIRLSHRTLQSKIIPREVAFKPCPVGAAVTFILPRGVYATTFLLQFFLLAWGRPIPKWLKTDEVNAKLLFGTGDVEKIKPYLGEYLTHLEGDSEEMDDEKDI